MRTSDVTTLLPPETPCQSQQEPHPSLACWSSIAKSLERIAEALDPKPPEYVDGPYVAGRLGLTTTRVAQMARDGIIPASCVVPGTGDGKPWKFVRSHIEAWIAAR
jgi:hypothetical protein